MKLLITLWMACLGIAAAAEPQRNLGITPASGEKRVALVIGNSAYKEAPLKNPVNDARDMAETLRRLGFDVIEKTNVGQKDINRAIAQFGEKLRADTVALFFYAGHGMQVKGKNYIIPIDAHITSEATVRAEAVDVDTVMDQLAISPMNIVILDACRNNPFERKFRSTGGGLAQMDAPKGSLIAYATAPGKTAADGDSRNGLYTQELLKHIQTPGLPLEAVFKRVRNGVMVASGEAQTPWEASSLTGDFFFLPSSNRRLDDASPSTIAAPTVEQIEQQFWLRIRDSQDAIDFEDYLKQYPQGLFVAEAQLMRRKLGNQKRVSDATPSSIEVNETGRDGRFIAYENGTVLDTRTKLMWAAKDNGANISWTDAKIYAEAYRGGGYNDWRLPTRNEIGGIAADADNVYPSECVGLLGGTYNIHLTSLIRLTCSWVWTSELGTDDGARALDFDRRSFPKFYRSASSHLRVLPVRYAK